MTVTKTTLYCPDDADALIGETLEATLDSRVIETSIEVAPEDPPLRRGTDSDVSYAKRCWADLLPTTATNQLLQFRTEWGWKAEEAHFVIHALERIKTTMLLAWRDAVLSGTKATLQRDSEKITALQWRWKQLEGTP